MNRRVLAIVVVTLAAAVAAACSSAAPGSQLDLSGATPTIFVPERYTLQQSLDFTITLTTTSVGGTFGRLDSAHSCEGGDTSPHLAWEGVPEGVESLALVMEDPGSDVYGFAVDVLWTHWVLYSIPPDVRELSVGQPAHEVLNNDAVHGVNDYEKVGYSGPCPLPSFRFMPSGASRAPAAEPITAEERPYYFRLYALDSNTGLAPSADRDTLLRAIDGNILAAGEVAIPYKSRARQACRMTNVEACIAGLPGSRSARYQ